MVRWLPKLASGPIGVDISPHSVKLIQLNDRRTHVVRRWKILEDLVLRAIVEPPALVGVSVAVRSSDWPIASVDVPVVEQQHA